MPTLHEALAERRFGLVLSAGYFGFFAHAGHVAGDDLNELGAGGPSRRAASPLGELMATWLLL